jgi:hypothetical protein
MMSVNVEQLRTAVGRDAAMRRVQKLQPVGGTMRAARESGLSFPVIAVDFAGTAVNALDSVEAG